LKFKYELVKLRSQIFREHVAMIRNFFQFIIMFILSFQVMAISLTHLKTETSQKEMSRFHYALIFACSFDLSCHHSGKITSVSELSHFYFKNIMTLKGQNKAELLLQLRVVQEHLALINKEDFDTAFFKLFLKETSQARIKNEAEILNAFSDQKQLKDKAALKAFGLGLLVFVGQITVLKFKKTPTHGISPWAFSYLMKVSTIGLSLPLFFEYEKDRNEQLKSELISTIDNIESLE